MSDLLIWWTNQADCEVIADCCPQGELDSTFPACIRDQYRSRYGRNGRGRLWVDEQFGAVGVDPWPDTPLANALGESPRLGQTYAGIVIRGQDAPLFDEMPGILTTLELKRYRG